MKRVASDQAVPVEVVCQAVEWWFISAFFGQPGWGVPRRLNKVPDKNPAGYLYRILPDPKNDPGAGLVSAYVEASANKAAELGVDPDGFILLDWLDDQHKAQS